MEASPSRATQVEEIHRPPKWQEKLDANIKTYTPDEWISSNRFVRQVRAAARALSHPEAGPARSPWQAQLGGSR